ncbi:hypothetical protein GCM10009682_41150 [Luedemannella flava]|uniref:Uncharacterized protein n=1 Tax=Luedemannella flava TaxID=349316 RepID=A0ABP4YJQ2_9ACTN
MRRVIRGLIVVPLVTIIVSLFHAPAAHAGIWQLNDGFEYNPTATWACWHTIDDPEYVNGCRLPYLDAPNPHGGTTTSWIQGHSGWSDIGRTVSITPYRAGRTMTCAAQIYGRMITGGTQLNGQLQVIDSATWRYTSIKKFTLTKANDLLKWRAITTASWVPAGKDVYIRIGIDGENIDNQVDALELDDLIVQCQYT